MKRIFATGSKINELALNIYMVVSEGGSISKKKLNELRDQIKKLSELTEELP